MTILNELEIVALKKIAQKALDPNLATKQITDLTLATAFDPGDLLLIRKTGEGVDKAITQQTFIETLGNPSVVGFTAVAGASPNQVVLTPSNDVVIDKYYDKMVVTFISPITSTGAVSIGIDGLTYKLLQEIGTANTSTLITGKFYQAIFYLADDKFYQTNIIKTIDNPVVIGFTAVSNLANQLILTPSNNIPLNSYYDGMVITFISPINSTADIQVKIGTLPAKTLKQLGTNTTSILQVNKFYEAVYIGDFASGSFYQTNIVVPYIFTNEYIAVGTVQPGNASTKYALTSAIGTPKTATGYYKGMAALFTTDIASQGAIILNIDGLGEKSLQDPVGDDIPFDLLANEAITAIYDGTVFRKRMFTDIEPIDPDPIVPPADITVAVGPTRSIKTIQAAIAQLVRDYTESGQGRTATIQLDTDFTNSVSYTHQYNTPWITVKTALAGNLFTNGLSVHSGGRINLEGTFNFNPAGNSVFLNIQEYAQNPGVASVKIKNSTINYIGNQSNVAKCVKIQALAGVDSMNPTIFENVNVNGFYELLEDSDNGTKSNFQYNGGTVSVSGIINVSSIIRSGGTVTLNNVNFGNISNIAPNTSALIYISKSLIMNNVSLTTDQDISIVWNVNTTTNIQSSITNCNLRKNINAPKPAIISRGPLIIDGGNYSHTPGSSLPDIVAEDYVTAVIRLRNNPIGNKIAYGKGQIINE